MRRRQRENTLSLFAFQDIITGVAGVMLFILLLLVVQLTLRAATAATEFGDPSTPPPTAENPQPKPTTDREKLRQMQQELAELKQKGAEVLRAEASNIDEDIKAAQRELAEVMDESDQSQSRAEAMQSEMDSDETIGQKRAILAERDALQQELTALEQEAALHEGGKLVAFKAPSSGVGELWIADVRGTQATIFNVNAPRDAVTVAYKKFAPATEVAQLVRSRLQELTRVRNVVVLLRPSIAGTGPELLDDFRRGGFRVALELLDEDTVVTRPSEASP